MKIEIELPLILKRVGDFSFLKNLVNKRCIDHENDLINDVMEQLFFYQLTMQMKITGRRSISMVHLYK